MNRTGKLLIPALCLACAAQQGPLIRTETSTVLVEAVVTGKKGDPIHGLTPKDFRIWQDGKEQAVTSVSEDPKTAEPNFLIFFFDDSRMAPQDQFQARRAVARFIDANAAPHESMAVVSYDGSLRIAQNFTDNAGRLKDAMARIETSSSATTSSKLERQVVPSPASGTDSYGARNMLQALGGLARSLGVLPGRKTLVLLSGGLPATSDIRAGVATAMEVASRSGVAIYPVDVRPIAVDDDSASAPSRTAAPTLRGRGRTQGNSDDSSSPAQDPVAASQQFLASLASGTGGFFIQDANEMAAGLQRIAGEQTDYYVLSYTPPQSKDDSKEGACHELRVKVDRGGASVRARSSYCSTPPLDLIGHTDAALELENRAGGGDVGNLRASAQLPYFYVSAGIARVHLSMDLAIAAVKFASEKAKPHAEINLLGIAMAADGSTAARVSDTIHLDYANQEELDQARAVPLHYEKEFKIAPGKYTFSLAFSAGDGGFGKIEAPLDIPSWNGAELGLSAPVLSHETRPAADLGLLGSLIGDQTALIAGALQYVPAGSSRFAKAESGFFYLEVYDPDPASVRVRVRVVDRTGGGAKWDSGVTRPPLPAAGKTVIAAGASLRIETLGPGSYRLEITASDASGKQVESSAGFDVD